MSENERVLGAAGGAIELVIEAKPRPIDAFTVRRALPVVGRRNVGPFVFFDHMGPTELAPGAGMDVRPHPHIHLATITYLFEGGILHRDSLGSEQLIEPGAVNWMTAGRGIVHSERTPESLRRTGGRLHGLQLWIALPRTQEDVEPSFRHYPAEAIPELEIDGVKLRVLAGEAYGVVSPVETLSRLVYVEAMLPRGASLTVPDEEERAIYVVEGAVECAGRRVSTGELAVLSAGGAPALVAPEGARLVVLGGAALDGPRFIEWNFVSSSKERIEQAKTDWREGRFPLVPGDELERIPLPVDG
jgi:redox-sensitive bicupin YhaK (pirin superfamily)